MQICKIGCVNLHAHIFIMQHSSRQNVTRPRDELNGVAVTV